VGEGVSAHCMYIPLVGVVVVVGLYLYLRWLTALRWEMRLAAKASRAAARRGCRAFMPDDMLALLYAIAVSLLGGEILYPYRPSFAFMGMFLFLCAVVNHPALVFGVRGKPADRWLPAVPEHPTTRSHSGVESIQAQHR